jgi:hypothetical protein
MLMLVNQIKSFRLTGARRRTWFRILLSSSFLSSGRTIDSVCKDNGFGSFHFHEMALELVIVLVDIEHATFLETSISRFMLMI